jgi:hypothetical protein
MNALPRRFQTRDFKAIATEKVLAVIRAEARKNGKNKLSMQEIDREIRAYRRWRSLQTQR